MILRQKKWCTCIRMASISIFLLLCFGATVSTAQKSKEALPTVATAEVPFYPPEARIARIEGVVHLRLSTDGMQVSAIHVESGHPALVQAAQENVRTWKFKHHSPTTFETTFRYRMLPESECEMDNGTVLLRLPTETEVSAKGVQTCDPTTEGQTNERQETVNPKYDSSHRQVPVAMSSKAKP